MSAKKEAYTSFILDELKKGNIEYKSVMSLFISKWQLSERQFVRYWNGANEAYKLEREAIEKEKAKNMVAIEIETAKSQIYDKAKMIEDLEQDIVSVKELLSKGYILKQFTIDGKKETKKEIFGVKEIEALNRIKDSKYEILKKMQGWDSPKQVEQTNLFKNLSITGISINYDEV